LVYHRFYPGRIFPRTLWVRDYYIYNYASFGLPPPAPDTQWIRYGPDLLLLDLDTGFIRQVVYGAFDEGDEGDPGDGGA
jgi:Ni/Co efflux regulator RcnB